MSQPKSTNQELEHFIEDWYFDENSHQYAQALGQFLFDFLADLKQQNFSEKTIKKHTDNCWFIGSFQCGYGYYDKPFKPHEVFYSPEADYESEFERKVSDSEYALSSYRATWKKIHKYADKLGLLD
jgi:hypothetical protein